MHQHHIAVKATIKVKKDRKGKKVFSTLRIKCTFPCVILIMKKWNMLKLFVSSINIICI